MLTAIDGLGLRYLPVQLVAVLCLLGLAAGFVLAIVGNRQSDEQP